MSFTPDTPTPPRGDLSLAPLPMVIFGSRWLQLPLYLGLIVAQGVYVVLFLKELWHLITHATIFTEQQIMLVVLGLIDVVMISNLLVMVIVGGYETFVSRLRLEGHPDQPEWLEPRQRQRAEDQAGDGDHRHLLDPSAADLHRGRRARHRARQLHRNGVMWQTIIHIVFILSAIGIAFVDRLSQTTPPDVPDLLRAPVKAHQ